MALSAKGGNVTLRTLLIHVTRSVLQLTTGKTDRKSVWAEALKERSCANVAAVPLTAKIHVSYKQCCPEERNNWWQAKAYFDQPIHQNESCLKIASEIS